MMSKIKKLLRKIVSGLGYELVAVIPHSINVRKNVFNTSFDKTVLLSYIKNVFINSDARNDRSHTNRYTTYIIAEILSELGYNVDVINYYDQLNEDYRHYELVIGLGKALDYVIENRSSKDKTKVIWFGTGCNPLFSNFATLNRLDDFYNRNKLLLFSSTRYIKEDWPLQHEFSDWIILHGSTFAKSTYKSKNISTIHAPVFVYHSFSRTSEDWSNAKKNYLWFGSGGLIHKGLDLLLDTFKNRPNVNLHICGNLEEELQFFNYAKEIIDTNINIHYHGFVDVKSLIFREILRSCAFVIFPSVSEGNSPSVITCMANGGLIPIVPKSTDIDLNEFGISIKELNVNAIIESINESQLLSTDDLKNQSKKILEESTKLNSFEYFREDFKLKLQVAINTILKNELPNL
jgi:glycosyltransferase involved in cell wall biosynthesis